MQTQNKLLTGQRTCAGSQLEAWKEPLLYASAVLIFACALAILLIEAGPFWHEHVCGLRETLSEEHGICQYLMQSAFGCFGYDLGSDVFLLVNLITAVACLFCWHRLAKRDKENPGSGAMLVNFALVMIAVPLLVYLLGSSILLPKLF